ncbi:hypothetical protein HYPSUDRAFT_63609 [Hypholoma sublateritium FD-334 SS-4]|uniref:Type II toxin-antitoxin system PemK/MazF family toxin n=1 Tax=Hypholoma sublateritium (strain FD-334 SS-4) TaxID=945553 RepID=A0A0D2MS71_HYPSF|nr:hypothetical protein HYPSUDRAFT_63609 [Hypholoma sublateritium FD-334 SS-4]
MSYQYFNEGDIMKAKPKHFIPRPEGAGNVGQHPVIILTSPDPNGYVLVAPMSHNHPDGTPTRRASRYGLPVDPVKGESQVNVGHPKVIHQDNLRPNKPHAAMRYQDYLALKTDIFQHVPRQTW